MSTTKVKFNEAISCMDGSFGGGQVVDLPNHLAEAWLKSGQVSLATKAEAVTPVVTDVVKTPFTPKDQPKPIKQPAPKPVAAPKPKKVHDPKLSVK